MQQPAAPLKTLDERLDEAARHQAADRFAEAEALCREVLEESPEHVGARCRLGAIQCARGQPREAWTLLETTVQQSPGSAEAHATLGNVLLDCNQPLLAERHLREAVRLCPSLAVGYKNLGWAHVVLRRFDEAEGCFREAIRLNPHTSSAHKQLAHLLQIQGRFGEAVAELRQTLHTDPEEAGAIAGLCQLAAAGHVALDESEVQRFRELAARPDRTIGQATLLHFALAWLEEAAGEYDRAFAHYRAGNDARRERERRRGMVFDPAAHHDQVDRLIAAFSAAYFARVQSFGNPSELPVFIVGMPRSGTTLAEQILANHPQVHGAGELSDFEHLTTVLLRRLEPGGSYPECLTRLDAKTTQLLAAAQLHRLRWLGGNASHVVDKLPVNYLHLGLIATLFPHARIVHCRRDPVDTCVSCYAQYFACPHPWSLDLGHLGHYYRAYERVMAHWAEVLPLRVFELPYEELTANQEAVSRRLLAFCDLEWDARCLRFYEHKRPVQTASNLQVRRPLYSHAVGRAQRFQKHLQPLLDELRR